MSQFKHLLVAVDFSEPSIKALGTALELAFRLDARLTVVHTVLKYAESVSMEGGAGYDVELYEKESREARERIEKFLMDRNTEGVETNIMVVAGRAQDQINYIAEKMKADVLILGTHGRKGVNKLILGSVAEEVLRDSHLPFLCVRG